jgi:predicted phosphodiesterase
MKLSLEQKIIKNLAERGYITHVGDITKALREEEYAEKLLSGKTEPIPDLDNVVEGECDHEPLTNDEIQEVFDNDEN